MPPFCEKIAYVSIFCKISSCEQKKERDLSRKYRLLLKKKARHTLQGDYSGLSYDINIYNPEFHRFEKKLLMSGFLERNSSCWAKEERDLSRKYTL